MSSHYLEQLTSMPTWEERYIYLVEIGSNLPRQNNTFKIEENRVKGCQSRVWLTFTCKSVDDKIHVEAESDAMIVRGLLALLLSLINGKSPQEVLAFDINIFEAINLQNHISAIRIQGLDAVISKIKEEVKRMS